MPPDISSSEAALREGDQSKSLPADGEHKETPCKKPEFRAEIVWKNVIGHGMFHVGALYAIYLMITSAKILTTLLAFILHCASILGITAGVHRLWSHRSYKATWQLQLILMTFQTLAYQAAVFYWAREHRLHHKYSDTDADPHNSKRGFFFSHIGWLMVRKHPDVKEKGKGIDLSDIENNPILSFQKKYYTPLVLTISVLIPLLIPVYCWNESWKNALFIAVIFRHVLSINITFMINSLAHVYGTRPYDKSMQAVENKTCAFFTLGEGWHNYHHTFPWDYKTSELGFYRWNYTTAFIDFFARIGWATDLKTVSNEMIQKRIKRTGDGTHGNVSSERNQGTFDHDQVPLWGWGDEDQSEEDKKDAIIINSNHDE